MYLNAAKYIFVFLLGLLVAFLLTPLVMRLAVRIGMVDRPDERRLHKGVIPRGGGIAVFAGFHLACAALYFIPWPGFTMRLTVDVWLAFLPASAFLLLVGIIDDYRGLRPVAKLGCQTIAALSLYIGGFAFGGILSFQLPWYVSCVLTVFWCLGFINAFNLIDGLDGLAAGLGIIAATGLMGALLLYRIPGDAIVLLAFIGACLGFLRYNFAPARVFLGDSGSMFIGFTLAAISLQAGFRGTMFAAMSVPLLAAGVPILDTALAIWRRSVRRLNRNVTEGGNNGSNDGNRVFTADGDHLHHRLLRTGRTHRRVAVLLYLVNGAFVAVGLLALAFHSLSLVIYMTAFVVAVYVVVRHLAHVELWHSGIAIANGLRRPPRRAIVTMLYPLADLSIMAVALLAALFCSPVSAENLKDMFMHRVAVWVSIPFLFLAVGGVYRRIWSHARITDYVLLVAVFSGGVLVTMALGKTAVDTLSTTVANRTLMFWSLSLAGLTGIRMFPRIMQDNLPFLLQKHWIDGVDQVHCLVYGAGRNCTIFMRDKANVTRLDARQLVVAGLLDDDSNVHGRSVYGCRVLGGIEKLETAVKQHHIQEIVVTTELNESTARKLKYFAETNHIPVLRWHTELKPMFQP